MNYNDMMARQNKLNKLKARLIGKFGTMLQHTERSNEYVGMECNQYLLNGNRYTVIWVDGDCCSIEKEPYAPSYFDRKVMMA